jgi:transposase-like protein
LPKYSNDTKAAVIAMVAAGATLRDAAEQHGCSHMAVRDWVKKAGLNLQDLTQKPSISDLLENYIREVFLTLVDHLELSRNPKWRDKQGAAELATFDGVHTDKCFRVLESIATQQRPGGHSDNGQLPAAEV